MPLNVSDVQILVPLHNPAENGWAECKASIDALYPNVEVLCADDSELALGFTANCNRLLRQCGRNLCLLLNQDTLLSAGCLEAMVERFNQSPKAGIVSAQIRSMENRDLISFGGALQCYPNGMHKGGYGEMLNVATKERWLTFVAVMFKREALQDVGLLDPNFVNLFSDSDWCFRARSFGYECWYEPLAKVYHKGGVSQQPNPQHRFDFLAFTERWLNGGLYGELSREVL